MEETGIIHVFSGKNNCSKRTQIAAELAKNSINGVTTGLSNKKAKRKYNLRETKLKRLMNVKCSKDIVQKTKLEKNLYLFTTKTKEEFLNRNQEIIETFSCTFKIKTIPPNCIINTRTGARMMESNSIPVFILVPRRQALCNAGSPHMDVHCLDFILNKFNKSDIRGKKCSGISVKYATIGAHCKRFGKGFSITQSPEKGGTEFRHVSIKMMERVKLFAKQYLPVPLMSLIKDIKTKVDDKITVSGVNNTYQSVWASLASSYNYISPAHVDKDAFISCLMCSHVPSKNVFNEKHKCTMKQAIACYFCFPEWGRYVALRPGDILFFNPLHYHCISDRTEAYKDEKVFVTSFYLKTAQIGRNDNDIDIENIIYQKDVTL